MKEKNTKIQFSKSVFGKQEIFSRLGQIRASLMVAEFPATGDNDDEMVVVMRTMMMFPPHDSLFSTSSHPFHSHFHQYLFPVDNMHSFTRKYGLSSQTNTFDNWMRNTSQMCRARSSAELIGVLSTVSACGGQVLR